MYSGVNALDWALWVRQVGQGDDRLGEINTEALHLKKQALPYCVKLNCYRSPPCCLIIAVTQTGRALG